MINIEKAIEIYYEAHPNFKISGILDTGDEWVISAVDRESGMEIDSSPLAVNKETGKVTVFFPPRHANKLTNAKCVDLSEIIIWIII